MFTHCRIANKTDLFWLPDLALNIAQLTSITSMVALCVPWSVTGRRYGAMCDNRITYRIPHNIFAQSCFVFGGLLRQLVEAGRFYCWWCYQHLGYHHRHRHRHHQQRFRRCPISPPRHYLTHWGRVTHICVSKLIISGSDYGLSPERRQAIT